MRAHYLVLLTITLVGRDSPTPPTVAEEPVTEKSNLPEGFDDARQTIGADKLLADVRKISGDEFEGRSGSCYWTDHSNRAAKMTMVTVTTPRTHL